MESGCSPCPAVSAADQGFDAACPAQHGLAGVAESVRDMVEDVRRMMAGVRMPDGNRPHSGPADIEWRQESSPAEMMLGMARRLYRDRRQRADVFKAALFSEPAWDMLLDLFIAAREGRQVSITSACIGAEVPVATGLRWLQQLEREGLIERSNDPSDARRTWIRLSVHADRSMTRYLTRCMAPAVPLAPARAVA